MVSRRLPRWLEKIEIGVDRLVPFMLIVLTVLIVVDLAGFADQYHDVLVLVEYLIVAFFVVDLCFKWHHTKNAITFFRLYWLDVLAVFPFYLVFRMYYLARELAVVGEQAQRFLHEAVLVREVRVLRESGAAVNLVREGRFLRLALRGLRLLRARWYVTNWHVSKVSHGYRQTHHR